MFRYKYVIVTDLDEFIIPKPVHSYTELFSNITDYARLQKVSKKPIAYVFKNEYYFLDLGKIDTKTPYLLTQAYTKRMPVSRRGYAVKSATDPTKCVVMSNHNCIVTTNDVKKPWTLEVPDYVATNKHYKRCHFSRQKCDEMLQMFLTDNTALKYGTQLLKRFQKKAEQLFNELDIDIFLSENL